jgi:hypothetical protein
VSTDRHAAPPSAYERAICAGSKFFGDHGRLAVRVLRADRADEVAQIARACGEAQFFERGALLGGAHFFALHRNDFFEDIAHGGLLKTVLDQRADRVI